MQTEIEEMLPPKLTKNREFLKKLSDHLVFRCNILTDR